jgi:hypothetical protein
MLEALAATASPPIWRTVRLGAVGAAIRRHAASGAGRQNADHGNIHRERLSLCGFLRPAFRHIDAAGAVRHLQGFRSSTH